MKFGGIFDLLPAGDLGDSERGKYEKQGGQGKPEANGAHVDQHTANGASDGLPGHRDLSLSFTAKTPIRREEKKVVTCL
jgi:hypothetical protein